MQFVLLHSTVGGKIGFAISPIHFNEDIASVDVGLSVVCPHRNGLTVQGIRLSQSRFIARDQIGQIEENIEVVGRDSGLVTLARLGPGQQRFRLRPRQSKVKTKGLNMTINVFTFR